MLEAVSPLCIGGRGYRGPLLAQGLERVLAALVAVGVTRLEIGEVVVNGHELAAFVGITLGKQAGDWFLRGRVGVPVVEVAVGKGKVHGLVQRVDITCAVVAHGLQVETLQQVQCLQQGGPLGPGGELVDVDAAVVHAHRLFKDDLPVGEVFGGDEAARGTVAAHDFGGKVAAVETLIGGHDGGLAVGPRRQCTGFRLHQFL